MNDIEKLQKIADAMYVVCVALVSITEHECCSYGFDDIIDIAEKYCLDYEADHEKESP